MENFNIPQNTPTLTEVDLLDNIYMKLIEIYNQKSILQQKENELIALEENIENAYFNYNKQNEEYIFLQVNHLKNKNKCEKLCKDKLPSQLYPNSRIVCQFCRSESCLNS